MKQDNILDISDITDDTGAIRSTFHCKDDSDWVPDGNYIAVRENGGLLLGITYRQGVVHGAYRDYWSNGKVACEGQFHEGKQEGTWCYYNEDGSPMGTVHFKEGKATRTLLGEG